ncbi:hypothetical protein F4780DRAFT_773083 [Xylariomycetidae sp. FL0641]|nr:hypothetical protein F4780DRAFT_773083 [Xylariomycetidae sp. FL0641]
MALPLSLQHDEERSVFFLSDSEDDDLLPPRSEIPRTTPAKPQEQAETMRQKTRDAAANVPLHPIPAMQPAFTESLVEATNHSTASLKPKLRFADAKQRRAYLLEARRGAKLHGELWRYRPGQKHHELWKLLAQISFGVYLLLNGIANSNEQVVTILQGHIDEVDEFLETTLEDINLAVEDVKERIDHLKLPMENVATFEQMLEDRDFRLQIVTGNEKIEHVVSRTNHSLEATLIDVGEGLRATKEFAVYLGDQQHRAWREQRPELEDIFNAMKGNTQGWYKAFIDLQDHASQLETLLMKLGQMVAEMDQRAGEVSRRTRFSVTPYSGPSDRSRSQDAAMRAKTPVSGRRPSAHQTPTSPPTFLPWLPAESSPARERPRTAKEQSSRQRLRDVKEDAVCESIVKLDINPQPKYEPRRDPEPEPEREPKQEPEAEKPAEDEEIYILQPRTYTPLPPEPIPSPMVHDSPRQPPRQQPQPQPEPELEPHFQLEPHLTKRTSLRERVSLNGGNLPEVIQIPPRQAPEFERPRYPPSRVQSPGTLTPHRYQGPDSAYGSEAEFRPTAHSMADPMGDLFPLPPRFPTTTIPSPHSEQQVFYPVRASPHSPLQQRPWTSGTAARPYTAQAVHARNQPSAMGMSMLSNVTTLNPNNPNKTLKKKRSAFGWLKKAFTLDEEERAQFEARKQQTTLSPYNDSRSPRFLDGKRLPEQRQYQ